MFELFYKFLVLHKRASLPGIGSFAIVRQTATFDFDKKLFVAPTTKVVFDSRTSEVSPTFFKYVANQQKLDESEAETVFTDFAQRLRKKLDAKRSVQLPGLGILEKNTEGEFRFEPIRFQEIYLPGISSNNTSGHSANQEGAQILAAETEAQEVLVEDGEGTNTKKDYWWVFAIILALIAIASILYYYTMHGQIPDYFHLRK